MNFVFVSPNYPENYWMFCRGLKHYGARVLAIVDTPYENLSQELKENIDDCYVVSSFHNYDEMIRACGYFTYKYGKIDWIESNNEAWLSLDARLRDDFNVKTGFSFEKINEFQSKAAMKKYYEKAGIPTARYYLVDTLEHAIEFANNTGYPLVLKPDHGVGASCTYTINNENDLRHYYETTRGYQMILEEYVDGDIFTLDGICDAQGQIRYLNSLEYVGNCMDSVLYHQSIGAYTTFKISKSDQDVIERTISAFELKNRFFHCEFFRLGSTKEGLGKKGDVIGLEVNFRPPGGFAPDLMNFAGNLDVYDLWAEVLLTQNATYDADKRMSAGFAGRRNSIVYKYSVEEIESLFNDELLYTKYLPEAFAAAMGDVTISCRFETKKRRNEFFKKSLELEKE